MSDYTKATNFTAKDSLPTGNSGKIVKGAEIDTELSAVSSAIASKANINSPTFTGTPAAPTATTGSNTTQIATTAYVKQEIDALGTIGTIAAQDADDVTITGGSITGITDLAVADGGTGRSTLTDKAVLIGAGTNCINSVAPGSSGNVLTSDGTSWTSATPAAVAGLGLGGETWHSVSRSFGSTYTNTHGYPIAVSATASCAVTSEIHAYVDGTLVSWFQWQFNGCGSYGGAFIIVPPGSTYQLVSSQSVTNWVELY